MNNVVILTLLPAVFIFNSALALHTVIEGYYWRDFEGVIPSDALAGGLDRNGRPIYIGQVLYEEKLIPGKIYVNDNKIYFEWGYIEYTSTTNVKILCTQHPEKFEWVPTKTNEVVRLTNRLLVKGGYQPTFSTYIGRVYAAGETVVGKLICSTTDCVALFVTINGNSTQFKDAFEVLSFNPNKDVDVKCPIDIRFSPE